MKINAHIVLLAWLMRPAGHYSIGVNRHFGAGVIIVAFKILGRQQIFAAAARRGETLREV